MQLYNSPAINPPFISHFGANVVIFSLTSLIKHWVERLLEAELNLNQHLSTKH